MTRPCGPTTFAAGMAEAPLSATDVEYDRSRLEPKPFDGSSSVSLPKSEWTVVEVICSGIVGSRCLDLCRFHGPVHSQILRHVGQ
jgi:hypothetical protein